LTTKKYAENEEREVQRGWAEIFVSRLYDHCFQTDTKQLLKNVP
jgi:hypothetical protein